jgi:hypothetical protein
MQTLLLMLATALPAAGDKAQPKTNTLTPQEIADGWILLFDGETTFGWKAAGDVQVKDGRLVLGGAKESLLTCTAAFVDYDLSFEFLAEGKGAFRPGWRAPGRTSVQKMHISGPWATFVLRVRGSEEREEYQYTFPGAGGGGGGSSRGGPVGQPKPWGASQVLLGTEPGGKVTLRNLKLRPIGLKAVFNGKDLTGWKEIPGKKSKFSVTKEGWLNVKDGPGDLQTEKKWGGLRFTARLHQQRQAPQQRRLLPLPPRSVLERLRGPNPQPVAGGPKEARRFRHGGPLWPPARTQGRLQ